MDITKIDYHLASVGIEGADIEWISGHDNRISVHGMYYNEKESLYMRVPDSVLEELAKPSLNHLAKHTAGGRLRFKTNSKYISIKAALTAYHAAPHMPITLTHGFSVYANGVYRNRYSATFKQMLETEFIDDNRIVFAERKLIADTEEDRIIDVYFPHYGGVGEIYIGVDKGATFEAAPGYKIEKPMVFYGSSITQGACVSRPGNDYVSIVARRFESDFINLGFSGSGNAEAPMIDYINSIDAWLYAFDYNYYPSRKDRVLPPHFSIYERIREKHPEAVILMYDKPGCDYEPCPEREEIICATYEKAVSLGDKKVCYIPVYDLLGEGDRDCCMADVSHPTDLGAMRIADAICKTVGEVLK